MYKFFINRWSTFQAMQWPFYKSPVGDFSYNFKWTALQLVGLSYSHRQFNPDEQHAICCIKFPACGLS